MTDCPPPPAIECRGLRKSFGGGLVRALDNVSLAIRSREFFTLLGPSGCGKSTLLRMIGGFEQPDHGSILLDGEPLDGLPPYRRPVNTVFQSYAVFPHMTVAGNIAFGLQMRGRSRAEIARRVGEMLALVKLDGLGGRKPSQLSGGQQQRVALARALAGEPRVLLLDEPLSALDRKLRAEMQAELKRLQAVVGITFIFVTHDQTEALAMSDRIAVMHAGRILQVGTPRDIYEHPATRFVAEFIGETNLLDAVRIGPGRFRLSCGVELAGADAPPGGPAEVTLAIRPERAILSCEPDMGDLTASVERLVYLGTDLAYELRLPDGRAFRVREQNRGGVKARTEPGARVALRIPPEAIHVLDE